MAMPAPIVPLPATPTVLISVILPLSSLDEAAAGGLALDLVGAFPDLRHLGVAHQPLDAILLAIAVAAVELHRLGRDAHSEVGGAHLQHRRLDAELARAAIDEPRDMPQ